MKNPSSRALRSPLIALFFASALFGCAKGEEAKPLSANAIETGHQQLEGSLTENAAKLLTGSYRAECDEAIEPLRQEIAAALDARKDEIANFVDKSEGKATHARIDFGPSYFMDRIEKRADRPGWTETKSSWEEIFEAYREVKGTPVSASWRYLNGLYRGTIVDEVSRIVHGLNYQVSKDSEAPLRRLLAELQTCFNNPTCLEPTLSPESLAFVSTQVRTRIRIEKITRFKDTPQKARDQLEATIEWLKIDLRFFTFRPNALVRRVAPDKYELPFDFGDYAPVADRFTALFEDTWKTDGREVKLKPQSHKDITETYFAMLGKDPGGRAYVSHIDKQLVLQPGSTSKAIAHELGHVLGFRDLYFDVWNPQDCSWASFTRDDDVMSNHINGKVLEHHWAKLEEFYK